MVPLRRISPVLPVRDVTAALERFRVLGFRAHAYSEGGPHGPIYGFVASGEIELHVALVPDLDPMANTSACYLYVDDADELYTSWSTSGVGGRFVAPTDTPYGLREFAHVDVDGNLLRVGSEMKDSPLTDIPQ